MATTFTSTTLPSTYRDDYRDSDNYHQILFNSGRALQARELTQLQTLIYEEMGRFGRNIFKEGAAVSSGGTAINAEYDYVKIASTNEPAAFEDIPVGTIFEGLDTGIKAKVLRVEPRSTDFVLNTLYIQYIDNNESAVTGSPATFQNGETLVGAGGYQLITEAPNATGQGVRFDAYEGDFFVMGRFVHANAQSIILSPYSNIVDAVVGFKVEQEIVTVNDTQDLYDNTGPNPNTASPGADRYRIKLTLTTQDKVTSDDIFVFIARVESSVIVDEIRSSDIYNKLGDALALRTNEESGDYIVNPFTAHYEDQVSGDANLDLIVSAGIAYVNGYRVENSSPIKLNVPKPLSTETVTNDVIPVSYGNYILADSCRGLPDLDNSRCTIFAGNGSSLGTAHIRAVEKDGEFHRVYLFDIDPIGDLNDARRIGTNFNTDYFGIVLQGDQFSLNQTTDNDLLFPTSRPRPESFSDITMTVQGRQSQTTDPSGVLAMSTLLVGQSYTDLSLWVVAASDESFQTGSVTVSPDGRDAQISGLTSGKTYEILYYYSKTATRKAKTLVSTTATVPLRSVGGINFYQLDHQDIFEVDSARNLTSSGFDMLGRFTLDDGQRDNFYDKGRLILNSQDSAPNEIFVNYSYYSRGVGDFYDATSYAQELVEIPTHTHQDGTEIRLFNYLDFRPDRDSDDTFSNIHELPRNGTNITADISYYLPRADKVIITQEGDIQVLMGQQAEFPQFKPTPDNALELYKVLMNANTLDAEDLQITPIDHKRYTMADIGKIEAKLDKLEEFTTLSLLELEQRMRASLDSDGNERMSSGSVVEDLNDQTGADTRHPDYSASIDPESRLIRPSVDEDNIRLVWDSALNPVENNITKQGDQIYLNYTEATWKAQTLASRSVNVNPFGIVDNVGTLKLSPSSDEWKECKEEAESAIAGSTKLDRQQAFLWNNWMWNWIGRKSEDAQHDYKKARNKLREVREQQRKNLFLNEKYSSSFSSLPTDTATGKHVSRVVSSDTLRSVVNGRCVDLALVPWMRSRKVFFHAKGLKPRTKFTPFFDGQNVSEWCRTESTFVRWADRQEDIGSLFRNSTVVAHPDGTTELTSDDNGEVIGSFFIPNIRPIYYVTRYGKRRQKKAVYRRFRTGVREFKLLDINENNWTEANSKCFAYYTALGAFSKRYNNCLSTRAHQAVTPWSYLNSRVGVYTPKLLSSVLNDVSAAGVGVVDPHLSGRYGPETTPLSPAALSGLDATGQMSQVLSDYIGINENQFSGANVNPLSIPQNPLAQTFYVDNQFGVVLTKVSLFFRAKDSGNLPISIHIRPVENNKPSTSTIVPDSHVFLNPSEVQAIGTDPQLSDVQATPTDFLFEEPIFLQPWTEYAIVVSSQSTEYELFSAKTKETVLGSGSRTVTTQPAPGSLFLPQNGVMWLDSKDQDLMFTLGRARFDVGGGSLILRNSRLSATALSDNPIRTNSGSSTVYVSQRGHGLAVGDEAYIDSCDVDVNGIPLASINGPHTIVSADIDGYTFDVGSSATESGFGGGERVLARRNKVFSVANAYVESIIPNFTSIDMSAKFTSGKYISGSNTRFVQDAQYIRVTPQQNIDFTTPKAIYNASSEDSDLGPGIYSSYVKVDLKTSNDYVSPIIDLQRSSIILAGYNIDNPEVTPHIYPVSEEEPYGATGGCRHISTPVTLAEPAVGIDSRVKVNLPEGSDLQFWYRTASSDQNINDQRWVRQQIESPIPNDNDQTIREARFLAGGMGGYLNPFNQVQTKIVLTGTNSGPMLAGIESNYHAH